MGWVMKGEAETSRTKNKQVMRGREGDSDKDRLRQRGQEQRTGGGIVSSWRRRRRQRGGQVKKDWRTTRYKNN